jgi:hypothetical protein
MVKSPLTQYKRFVPYSTNSNYLRKVSFMIEHYMELLIAIKEVIGYEILVYCNITQKLGDMQK